jgi:hypothetical protein
VASVLLTTALGKLMIVAALTDGDKRGAVAEKGNMQK